MNKWLIPLFLAACATDIPIPDSAENARQHAEMAEAEAALTQADYQTAYALLLPLAENGNAHARFALAHLYAQGHGVARDLSATRDWLERAAQQGHAPAQYQLAQMLPQDDRQTRQWYERAATQGFPPAQHQLAAWLEARRDYAQAARWYAQAAAHDIPAAQYALGRLYLKGHGVPADENQAIHWLELAAIQGETAAQFDLGMLHMQRGNRDRALSWLQQASATGHEEARKALKIMGM